MSGPIASAVVLPEAEDAPPAPASPCNPLKRRQSSVTEDSVKRVRANGHHVADESRPAAPKRREHGRERRLFGAVLGALSQTTTTAGQKRRSEIEKRQQAQRRQQDEEGEQREAERLARRKVQRWKEQRHFERQAMSARHDNMLHLAHFLCTKTEPRLYYKPWEISPEEQDRIHDQIAEAREAIQRERHDYEDRQDEETPRQKPTAVDAHVDHGDTTTLSPNNQKVDLTQSPSANQAATASRHARLHDHETKADPVDDVAIHPQHTEDPAMDTRLPHAEANADDLTKDADEEVVEAAEDTVIY